MSDLPPYIADEVDVDISHLISDADAGSWEFATGLNQWIRVGDALFNQAFAKARCDTVWLGSRPERALLTADVIRSMVEERGGHFYWRTRDDHFFASELSQGKWNKQFPGTMLTECISSVGYLFVQICQRRFYVHRLLWLFHHGDWPRDMIDHIDGNPLNNDLANLRDVSVELNMRNQFTATRNKSGRVGVHWDQARGRWGVTGFRNKRLGRFTTFEEAVAVRERFEAGNGFTSRHLGEDFNPLDDAPDDRPDGDRFPGCDCLLHSTANSPGEEPDHVQQ